MRKMMSSRNIAYTEKYQKQKEGFNYLFHEEFLADSNEHIFSDSRWRVICKDYVDKVAPLALNGKAIEVYNNKNKLIFEQKCYDDRQFLSYILHANGMEYLFFGLDLYGYSIFNLTTRTAYHYVPEDVLVGGGETFIWTNVVYSETDKIAVEGCFWACNHEFEIYDFSEPEKLPYKRLIKHEDLEPEYNNWLKPIGWTTSDEYAYDEQIEVKEHVYEMVRKMVKF